MNPIKLLSKPEYISSRIKRGQEPEIAPPRMRKKRAIKRARSILLYRAPFGAWNNLRLLGSKKENESRKAGANKSEKRSARPTEASGRRAPTGREEIGNETFGIRLRASG